MFQDLLSKLYALQFYYRESHWQAHNIVFYADHLLFERLSDDAYKYVDKLAEKGIGVTGDVSIGNFPAILKKTYAILNKLTHENIENSKSFEEGLKLEMDLQAFLKIADADPTQTIGVKALLEDIFDDSEGRVYLIKQRLSKGITPSIPAIIKKV